jgi:hypothetical protein
MVRYAVVIIEIRQSWMTVAGLSFRVDGQRDPVELDVRVSEGV